MEYLLTLQKLIAIQPIITFSHTFTFRATWKFICIKYKYLEQTLSRKRRRKKCVHYLRPQKQNKRIQFIAVHAIKHELLTSVSFILLSLILTFTHISHKIKYLFNITQMFSIHWKYSYCICYCWTQICGRKSYARLLLIYIYNIHTFHP